MNDADKSLRINQSGQMDVRIHKILTRVCWEQQPGQNDVKIHNNIDKNLFGTTATSIGCQNTHATEKQNSD